MDKNSVTQKAGRVKLAGALARTGGYVFDGDKVRPTSLADYVDETGDFEPGQEQPTFDLAIFTEMAENESEIPDFIQNPTFPAERGAVEHPGPCLADLPHHSMTLAQRVELLRGPVEEGID